MPLECVGFSSPAAAGEVDLPRRYVDINRVGQGATCIVLKARDSFLDREVAIKYMRKGVTDLNSLRRFQQEARVMSSFSIMHLPVVLDFGLSPGGRPYMVMEFVEGTSLSKLLEDRRALSVNLSLDITIQVLTALAHAHERGIIHRDLKSHNIMVSWNPDGTPFSKLVDFGLAHGADLHSNITEIGCAIGTPLYMSPEQAQGRGTDARSDIYSLGCVLFEMLTGKPPFEFDCAAETINAHVRKTAPSLGPVKGLSQEQLWKLRGIVGKMLAKDPNMRYQSANELKDVLEDLVEQLFLDEAQCLKQFFGVVASADQPKEEEKKPARRSWLRLEALQKQPDIALIEESEEVDLTRNCFYMQKQNLKQNFVEETQKHSRFVSMILSMVSLVTVLVATFAFIDPGMSYTTDPISEYESPWMDAGLASAESVNVDNAKSLAEDAKKKWQYILQCKFHITSDEIKALSVVKDADLALVARFPRAKSLKLSGSSINGEGLYAIETSQLESLDLGSHPICDTGFVAISKMPELKTLHLDYMPALNAAKLHQLSQTKSLETLTLKGISFNKDLQWELLEFTQIKKLVLDDASGLSDHDFIRLASLRSLKWLSLIHRHGITMSAIKEFRRMRPDVRIDL